MNFKKLEDKCLYYRGLSDYKLVPNSYVIVMLDGRSFSKMIKKRFERPFSTQFMNLMDATATYICQNVQGAKFAYVQSDEISIVLTDFDTPETDSFFGNRLCKIQSIIASMASGQFNRLYTLYCIDNETDTLSKKDIKDSPLFGFDCKAWNVPSYNDVYAWFLYRQNDCIKNSKQQAAQTYISHKELVGKNADEQIEYLKDKKNIDWNNYSNGEKYGRFIYKKVFNIHNVETDELYKRNKWTINEGFKINTEEGRNRFNNLKSIPKLDYER